MRLNLTDKPGALAKVASVLGDCGISIDRMRQPEHGGSEAPVLIVTHKVSAPSLADALEALPQTDVVLGQPVALRIENI